jgi:tetratricopeptide (TPR) repeat protein
MILAALVLGAGAPAAPSSDPLAEATAALERGDGIAAEAAARRALDAGAPRGDVAALIGEAELLQGDLADARDWLAGDGFSVATRERGFHALGRLEMADGNLEAAARAFDQALVSSGASGPGSARLWVDIGRLRYRAGQHYLAVDAAAKAIAIGPGDPRALEFQAQLTRDSHGVVAALPWFERALERTPRDLDLLGEYAATLGEAGRHGDMLRIARRMVEIDPRHPRAYFLQAVLAARAGRDDLARRLLERTNGAYGELPAGLLLAGVLELRTGNAALAAERFDDLARRQPENALAPLLLGRALLAHGEANEVVARLGAAADRPDASPYLLALVGRAHEHLGRRQEAARYLDRAAEAQPAEVGALAASEQSLFELAAIRAALGQQEAGEALAIVRELRARFPDSIDVEILGGDVAMLAGDPAEALAAYRRAATVRRDFALVERMAAAQETLGREDAAVGEVSGYLVGNPRSQPAARLLGRMLERRGDARRAGTLLAYARELGGGAPPERAGVAATLRRLAAASG